MKIEELYTPEVLALACNIPRLGRLDAPDVSTSLHSRLCGSRITVDLLLDGDVIADFAQHVEACALAQASAAILGRHVVGCSSAEMHAVRDALKAMLRDGTPPPGGAWRDLAVFQPVREVPERHDSVLLPFDAVCRVLAEVREK